MNDKNKFARCQCISVPTQDTIKRILELERLTILYGEDKVRDVLYTKNCDIYEVEDYIDESIKVGDDLYEFNLEQLSEEWNKLSQPPSIQQQIKNLKSRLKYCKSHLERVNIEREINRLKKEGKTR